MLGERKWRDQIRHVWSVMVVGELIATIVEEEVSQRFRPFYTCTSITDFDLSFSSISHAMTWFMQAGRTAWIWSCSLKENGLNGESPS